ncbi:MAG: MlaD family protein [Elusimicrobiota bacterium]|jgi:phospholipid/cholesterol/gamma-HCH transport system substrate-binding protein|nr:MlaD family protein [Elusimicrobiota bacterium]
MSNLVKVGLFTALGLITICVSIIFLGNWTFSKGYTIYVAFDDASGLNKKAAVRVAGVDIGQLEDVTLKGEKANLRLRINKDIKMHSNATAQIVSMGIIGTRYIDINLGSDPYPYIGDGATISATQTPSLEQLMQKIGAAVDSPQNGNMFENLAQTVRELKEVISNLNRNTAQINEVILNFNDISENLVSATLDIKEILTKIDSGSGTISALINDEQMSIDLRESVASAKATLASLNDTLGSADQMRFEWIYQGAYNTDEQIFRNDVGIKISPNPRKFYYVGVANLGDTANAPDLQERLLMNKLEALLGFRFNKFEVYAGVLKGTGGLGAGYSLLQPMFAQYKTLQLHVNIYDMGRRVTDADGNKESASKPKIDADLRVGLLKWLYVGVMIEDALHEQGLTTYIKIDLDDRDLAKVLGIAGIAASAGK